MELLLESINKNSKDIEKVKDLYYGSFPEVERHPMDLLFYKANLNCVDFLAIYDKDIFVGFTYLITHKNLTYVLYLAIDGNVRSKGYGSLVLSQIKEKYSKNQIILNIEVIDESAINFEQRVTRKKFYERNGYESSGLLYKDRWCLYEAMVNGEKEVTKEKFYDLVKTFTGDSLFLFLEVQITSTKFN
ncbi:GNAT family N-acetyltransferase [Cytobacillus sp. S13-E01]|uniref:GNAT family N-acetyltransferase n=1 Tax=Cytobacillus sp. S13-E01 TaxID=3031326 RepID=UPI0023D858F6|nr:GNAT family N-acetyltransferase [Cytobacillus sp. S13-E01]MDF0728422.1 GNAT family N-acetyltransferase [Cytobacillus sp. S13-E01]